MVDVKNERGCSGECCVQGVCRREEIGEEVCVRSPHRGGRGGIHGSKGTRLCCRGEGGHGMIGLGRTLE